MKTPDEEDALAGDGLCPLSHPSLPVPFEVEQSLGFQLRRIATLLGAEVDRRMEPLGLTDAQWKPLLRLLLDPPGTAAALARVCHLDAGGLTRLLDRLEAKGLCQRERSQEDRRVVNIALTPEGRAVAEQLPAILAGVQRELLAGFDEAEEARLRDFLARIYANTRAMPGS
ncbi:MarR family winged helix-turn-helix transcriptional regulator [Acidovorax sp. MR-S7]|uniref:MarR family winged helix-turn-helix transcriptional regulator n=1 Tax=Acidovorax sp. MR-S7 TaxID=1268622 RepID=UPI000370FBD7|nr:MarR family transcriptional regulator [Acidovorax sp. MR-S7]GAD21132.1 MarR family transcriptional regulator [Acidovorax sp. MR-S7]